MLIFLLIFNLSFSNIIDEVKVETDLTNIESKIDKIISNMTIKQKIGQLLIYGFSGTDASSLFPMIDKYNLGNIILFSHNINKEESLVNLIKDAQDYANEKNRIPMFISIDQEGGRVLRITEFGTVVPGNMSLGATRSSTLSFLAGKLMGIDLEMLGINMNFAPVIDVNRVADNKVIGARSFGDDPDMVSELGRSFIRGLQSRRVSATAKHFPGHGATSKDSHYSLPISNVDFDTLNKYDLKPFYAAIEEKVDAVMMAHIVLPKIDETRTPASMSRKIVTDILRKKMKYDGLVITDDLEMKAITLDGDIGISAVKAFKAGCDMIIVGWTEKSQKEVFRSLLASVKRGEITEQRINESLRRILRVKHKRSIFDYQKSNDLNRIANTVGNQLHKQISYMIASRSITLVKNEKDLVPISKNKKVGLITPISYLSYELNKLGIENKLIKTAVTLNKQNINSIINNALSYKDLDLYIVALVDDSYISLVQELKLLTKKPIVAISLDSPYWFSDFKDINAYICTYSFRYQVIEALAKVIAGDEKAFGKLPVNLNI